METGRKEALNTVQPRGKVAWLSGGRREGNVDISRASGEILMDLEMTGQGIPGGLACVHEGPFSEMDDASGGHGLGLDMRSLLLGPQKLRGV